MINVNIMIEKPKLPTTNYGWTTYARANKKIWAFTEALNELVTNFEFSSQEVQVQISED